MSVHRRDNGIALGSFPDESLLLTKPPLFFYFFFTVLYSKTLLDATFFLKPF